MSWIKWTVALGAFLVMLYTCALPPSDLAVGPDGGGDLGGVYTVNGVDPIGTEYSGTMTIQASDDPDRFDVELVVTGSIQRGQGTRRSGELTVVWDDVVNATGRGTGTTVYTIHPDGSMTGRWSAEGFDQPGVEDIFVEP